MNNSTVVFALDDDFSMGVLQSRAHVAWAWAQASTLETRLRYTPTSVFMTFPWAGAFATDVQREAVAEACRQLLARRSEICQAEQIGLTKLYNAMDEGAWADLKTLHQALDESVAACYGCPGPSPRTTRRSCGGSPHSTRRSPKAGGRTTRSAPLATRPELQHGGQLASRCSGDGGAGRAVRHTGSNKPRGHGGGGTGLVGRCVYGSGGALPAWLLAA